MKILIIYLPELTESPPFMALSPHQKPHRIKKIQHCSLPEVQFDVVQHCFVVPVNLLMLLSEQLL